MAKKSDKEEREYKCGWCGWKFKQAVGISSGGKHSTVSSQVVCPRCRNGLPTWGDGK